jgi:hypothetical protein
MSNTYFDKKTTYLVNKGDFYRMKIDALNHIKKQFEYKKDEVGLSQYEEYVLNDVISHLNDKKNEKESDRVLNEVKRMRLGTLGGKKSRKSKKSAPKRKRRTYRK